MLLRLQTHNRVTGSVGDCPTATQTLLGEDTLIGDKRIKRRWTRTICQTRTQQLPYMQKRSMQHKA